jgi:hypothetical protein
MSNAAARAGLDSIVGTLEDGALLRIYTGTQPPTVDEDPTGTLLAELPLSTQAFGPSSDGGGFAIATASTISDDASADAGGDPGYFRMVTSGGVGVLQGTAGGPGSGAEIEFNSATFQAGGRVTMNGYTQKLFES